VETSASFEARYAHCPPRLRGRSVMVVPTATVSRASKAPLLTEIGSKVWKGTLACISKRKMNFLVGGDRI
jgi:hypothetical protein